ncbi:MAG: DUF3179 domain-containing (seleno)protein [Bacteroidota bacterium]
MAIKVMNKYIFALVLFAVRPADIWSQGPPEDEAYAHFTALITSPDTKQHARAFTYLEKHWQPEFNSIAIELAYLSPQRTVETRLLSLLQKNTGQSFARDYNKWYEWLWNREQELVPYYHGLKALMHRPIDHRFIKYFKDRQEKAEIRLDEIRWGGVVQDGIPPLRYPKMILAREATYLDDSNEVFGIAVNGDFRAYPKRILAWHEMFVDTVGEVPVAGVYCTLCGTVILYRTTVNGENHSLGTSGFLYRSNKLMYDQKTQSLWSTLQGKPVVGPLVGQDIALEYLSTVTTTWGEWKKLHPETTVLDINTGFQRDYGEGVAYKAYFATDDLMFNVPELDTSLKNKQSILAIRIPGSTDKSMALSVDFLKENPIYHNAIGDTGFVVFTDSTGANRVYGTEGTYFVKYNPSTGVAIDRNGLEWKVKENTLVAPDGKTRKRLHSFNAFWFGWKAVYPETQLIK